MYDARMFDVAKLETQERLAAFCRQTRASVDQAQERRRWYRQALVQLGQGLITAGTKLKGEERQPMVTNGLGQLDELAC